MDLEEQRRAGWRAVWDSGLLTADPYVNANIWRCVLVALNGALGPEPETNKEH